MQMFVLSTGHDTSLLVGLITIVVFQAVQVYRPTELSPTD